jgi:hypothetical protein
MAAQKTILFFVATSVSDEGFTKINGTSETFL